MREMKDMYDGETLSEMIVMYFRALLAEMLIIICQVFWKKCLSYMSEFFRTEGYVCWTLFGKMKNDLKELNKNRRY